MATTTNYAWETPDDTDLVKDGAAAIRTLGSSVDTTTKALNPSTTLGDIEYRSATANTNTRLGIGSTGQVLTVSSGVPSWTTPATTSFVGCSLKNSVAISLANSTDVVLTFDEENYDTDSMHSTSSNTSRITIPSGQGGYYAFRWGAVFANNSSGNRRMRLRKNGTDIQNSALTTKGDGLTAISASTVIAAVAGDYFELTALQDSGGALDIGISNILFYEANKVG